MKWHILWLGAVRRAELSWKAQETTHSPSEASIEDTEKIKDGTEKSAL